MKFLRALTGRDTPTTDSTTTRKTTRATRKTTRAQRAGSASVRRAARDGQAWEDTDRQRFTR